MALNIKSVLKPEGSILGGVAVAALVVTIYQMNVGNIVQVHMTPAHNGNIEASRRKAAIQAVAAVSAVSLLTRDITIFILGGGLVTLLDWHVKHANAADNVTGQLVQNSGYVEAGPQDGSGGAQLEAVPSYG